MKFYCTGNPFRILDSRSNIQERLKTEPGYIFTPVTGVAELALLPRNLKRFLSKTQYLG